MNKAEALSILRDISDANESATKALNEVKTVSAAASGRAAERDWVNSIKEEKKDLGTVLV